MRAHPAAPDHHHEGVAQLLQPGLAQEDPVARQLLPDQLVVEVAVLGAVRKRLVVRVFFVGLRERADACYLLGRGGVVRYIYLGWMVW